MGGVLVPVMAFYPEPNLDYSLMGTDFTLVQTFLEVGSPASRSVLEAAKQKLESIFPTSTVVYDLATGKVTMTVTGVDRVRAETFLDALRTDIKFSLLS